MSRSRTVQAREAACPLCRPGRGGARAAEVHVCGKPEPLHCAGGVQAAPSCRFRTGRRAPPGSRPGGPLRGRERGCASGGGRWCRAERACRPLRGAPATARSGSPRKLRHLRSGHRPPRAVVAPPGSGAAARGAGEAEDHTAQGARTQSWSASAAPAGHTGPATSCTGSRTSPESPTTRAPPSRPRMTPRVSTTSRARSATRP